MSFKVCVLTAGTGSRMGEFSQLTNKSLLPIDDKAVISHIVDRFPDASEFVIACGFKSEDVQAYLTLAHPEIRFSFVNVSPYQGPGSGPGYSLWSCQDKLREPFYLVCGDTLWKDELPRALDQSWIGVAPVNLSQTESYCMIEARQGLAVSIRDKEALPSLEGFKAFVGLFFVHDARLYFDGLQLQQQVKGEFQISEGLTHLMGKTKVAAFELHHWLDVGTEEKYLTAAPATKRLRKNEEIFYHVGPRVIKFYKDKVIAQNRVQRAALCPQTYPKIVGHREGFYAYNYVPGKNLYKNCEPAVLAKLLPWLKSELWHEQSVQTDFQERCGKFYEQQTKERLKIFNQRNPKLDGSLKINRAAVPVLAEQMATIDWADLRKGIPASIHGDLQFGNIVFDAASDRFYLVDWRQDFAGDLRTGDLYYDLAKLYSGIYLDLDQLAEENYQLQEWDGEITLRFPKVLGYDSLEKQIREYIEQQGWCMKKVKTLSGMIFLRMSALHPAPIDRFLFYLGRHYLQHEC